MIQFNQFYRYDDLTAILQHLAQNHPHLVQLSSIGESYTGRQIWLLTVTNFSTGSDQDKPALWVDGNIHSIELSGSTACLYLLQTLVQSYGHDPEVTRCLDSRVFYICPRVNPDGAEWALADQPKYVRSSIRPYPVQPEESEGLNPQDIDGNGSILYMRIPDPNGAWKICPEDKRLMVRRDPTETGGQYYRILPEGLIHNYDGVLINLQPLRERLDLNRNFPAMWRPEAEQPGAGEYPTSEPEVRSLIQFIVQHRNITGAIAFHTSGGLLLRPSSYQADEQLPSQDMQIYRKIGQKGTELTQYPAVSVYHDFRTDQRVITGAFDDWMYEHQGVFAWTVELWSFPAQAGIETGKLVDWRREHPTEDDLALLRWSDEQLDGQGFVDWYEFEHPQLGQVELGGWNWLHIWANPPSAYLEQEVAPFPQWLVWHLLISPCLELLQVDVQPVMLNQETSTSTASTAPPIQSGLYRIRLVVQNTGWLPTYITQQALKQNSVSGCLATIDLPERALLIAGKRQIDLGQLDGRAHVTVTPQADPTRDRAKAEWIVQAPTGSMINLSVHHDRAGTVRTTVEL